MIGATQSIVRTPSRPTTATGFNKLVAQFLHSMERLNHIQFDAPWH